MSGYHKPFQHVAKRREELENALKSGKKPKQARSIIVRGGKFKPIAQRLAEGDRAKIGVHKLDELARNEPRAERGLPKCPRHLRGRARYAWEFWSAALELSDVARRPDAMMLEGACQHYAKAVAADLNVAKRGFVIDEFYIQKKTGQKILLKSRRNPADIVSNHAWQLVHRFCSEFGLSPVSRAHLAHRPDDDHLGPSKAPRQSLLEKLNAPRQPRAPIPPAPGVQ